MIDLEFELAFIRKSVMLRGHVEANHIYFDLRIQRSASELAARVRYIRSSCLIKTLVSYVTDITKYSTLTTYSMETL